MPVRKLRQSIPGRYLHCWNTARTDFNLAADKILFKKYYFILIFSKIYFSYIFITHIDSTNHVIHCNQSFTFLHKSSKEKFCNGRNNLSLGLRGYIHESKKLILDWCLSTVIWEFLLIPKRCVLVPNCVEWFRTDLIYWYIRLCSMFAFVHKPTK